LGGQQSEIPIPTFEPSVAPIETPTDEPIQTVVVLLTDVIGKSVADATIFLKERGLQVDATPGEPLEPGDPRILSVYRAEGLGRVNVGSTIRIFYYIEQAAVPSPTETTPGTEPTDGSSPQPTPTISPTPSPTPTDAG
jgi:beta-lactam-binding protein with PASTA domain